MGAKRPEAGKTTRLSLFFWRKWFGPEPPESSLTTTAQPIPKQHVARAWPGPTRCPKTSSLFSLHKLLHRVTLAGAATTTLPGHTVHSGIISTGAAEDDHSFKTRATTRCSYRSLLWFLYSLVTTGQRWPKNSRQLGHRGLLGWPPSTLPF